jgi:hypothetical protein
MFHLLLCSVCVECRRSGTLFASRRSRQWRCRGLPVFVARVRFASLFKLRIYFDREREQSLAAEQPRRRGAFGVVGHASVVNEGRFRPGGRFLE